jgi:hypothetical protein
MNLILKNKKYCQQIENVAETGTFKKRERFSDTGTVRKAVIPGKIKK